MRGKRTDDEVWVSVHLKWIQGAQRSREAVAWTGTVISSEYQRPGKHETEKVVDDPGVSTSTGNKQLVYRNSKLNLTWQAALTKVSRHSGDDSLRALVFYFYIYIYIYTAMVIGSRCGQWKGCRVSTQRRRPAPGEQNTATYLDHDG